MSPMVTPLDWQGKALIKKFVSDEIQAKRVMAWRIF